MGTSKKSTGVSARDVVPKIIGIEIWERYESDPSNTCISNISNISDKKQCRRCKQVIRKERRSRGRTEYSRLGELDVHQNPSSSLEAITAFFELIFCQANHYKLPIADAKEWFQKHAPISSSSTTKSKTPQLGSSLTSDVGSKPASSLDKDIKVKVKKHGTRSDPSASAAARQMNLFNQEDPTWEPYMKTKQTSKMVFNGISDKLQEPLTRKDAPGQIYCYSVTPFPGCFKIGYTGSEDASTRAEQWSKQCKRRAKLEFATKTFVSAAFRLEQLVATELCAVRVVERRCPSCEGGHDEWYRVTQHHAELVMLKWSTFMEMDPYIRGQDDRRRLDPVLTQDSSLLEWLCTPLDPESVTKDSVVKTVRGKVAATRQRHRRTQVADRIVDRDAAAAPPPAPVSRGSSVKEVDTPEPALSSITSTPSLQSVSSQLKSRATTLAEMVGGAYTTGRKFPPTQVDRLQSAIRAFSLIL